MRTHAARRTCAPRSRSPCPDRRSPQHFDDASDGLHIALGLLQDLGDDHLPGLGAERSAGRHQDVVLDPLVFRHDDRDAALVQQTSDQLVGAPLDDLDDLAFRPAPPIGAGDRVTAPGRRAGLSLISCSDSTRSGPASSRIRKPKPSRCPWTCPDSRFARAATSSSPARLRTMRPDFSSCSSSSLKCVARIGVDAEPLGQFGGRERRARGGQCVQYRVRHRCGWLWKSRGPCYLVVGGRSGDLTSNAR
jgi:hypothetical protein